MKTSISASAADSVDLDQQQSQLLTQDVIRHLAHELRQPLSTIETIAYYLSITVSGQNPAAAAQVERLQQMIDQANWVLTDVVHLLQLAPPAPASVDVNSVLREVILEKWLTEGMKLRLDLQETRPTALVDREQLRHVLRTAIHYLRRAGAETPSVSVSTRTRGVSVLIEFMSTLPEASREAFADPFSLQQLVSARQIVEAHEGEFLIEREGDRWLSVRVSLPIG